MPDDLPRRPRRQMLTRLPLTLLAVLLIACGFIAGVLVEKGQSTSSSSAGPSGTGLAARFAAPRGGTSGTGATGGASGGSGSTAGGGFFGRSGGAGRSSIGGTAGGGGATAGQVAYVAGSTLYVTTAEGNTVKVKTSPASTVTKTVSAEVKGIHPGETVVVTGATGANGAISAESIRVGAGAGGGLGALFGGSGAGSSGGPSRGSSSGGSSEPTLFGKGG